MINIPPTPSYSASDLEWARFFVVFDHSRVQRYEMTENHPELPAARESLASSKRILVGVEATAAYLSQKQQRILDEALRASARIISLETAP